MRIEELIGKRLGRYEVYEMLGRGGMAAVFRASDTTLRRQIALKVLYPQYTVDENLIERFRREAITAAQLEHRHIVPIYDVGEQQDFVYIAMKLLPGRALQDLLTLDDILPLEQMVEFLHELASALDYAHSRGVIHRDIKPGNIMIDGDGRAVLTDFGIAKSLDAPGLTSSGVLVGTPDYMAPEQIDAKVGPVGPATDQYALGVVVYRALTGQRPYDGTTMQLLYGHLHERPREPSTLNPKLPSGIDAVVSRAMAKRPEERFPTMGEFAEALEESAGSATIAGQTTPPASIRRRAPRVYPSATPEVVAELKRPADPDTDRVAPLPAIAPPVAPPPPREPTSDAGAAGAPAPGEITPATGSDAPSPGEPTPAAGSAAPPRRNWRSPLVLLPLLLLLVVSAAALIASRNRGQGNLAGLGQGTHTVTPTLGGGPSGIGTRTHTSALATTSVPATPSPSATDIPPTLSPTVPTATLEPSPTATTFPRATTSAPASTRRPTNTPTRTRTRTITATSAPSSTATDVPLPPTATPCPSTFTVKGGFAEIWNAYPSVRNGLRCPIRDEIGGSAAIQYYPFGVLYWWGPSNSIYAFLGGNSGSWSIHDVDVQPQATPTYSCPEGRYLPTAGFGRLLAGQPELAEALGKCGVTREEDGQGALQFFENGTMLWMPATDTINEARIWALAGRLGGTFTRYNDP